MRESRGQWRTARERRETGEKGAHSGGEVQGAAGEGEKEKEATKKSEVGNGCVR